MGDLTAMVHNNNYFSLKTEKDISFITCPSPSEYTAWDNRYMDDVKFTLLTCFIDPKRPMLAETLVEYIYELTRDEPEGKRVKDYKSIPF